MACCFYGLTRNRLEPAGSGATWTGSPKGVFSGRKHHKPQQGVVANTLKSHRNGAVGIIDWLHAFVSIQLSRMSPACVQTMQPENEEAGDDEQKTNDAEP